MSQSAAHSPSLTQRLLARGRKVFWAALPTCRETIRLISLQLDTELPWPRRIQLRIHLLFCVYCHRYLENLSLLRKLSRHFPGHAPAAENPALLPSEIRERLRESCKEIQRTATDRL